MHVDGERYEASSIEFVVIEFMVCSMHQIQCIIVTTAALKNY